MRILRYLIKFQLVKAFFLAFSGYAIATKNRNTCELYYRINEKEFNFAAEQLMFLEILD